MNDLSRGVRKWAQVSFVLSQIARLTDGRMAFSWLCVPCVALGLHAAA